MKGAVYCADPRLYNPLVFARIRWVRLSVPSCVSYCAPCYFSFLHKIDNMDAATPCAAWLWPWLLSLGWLTDLRNIGDEFAQFDDRDLRNFSHAITPIEQILATAGLLTHGRDKAVSEGRSVKPSGGRDPSS